jgi:hypothetical protein
MHPYLSEQLGAAHRADLLRVAASRNYYLDHRLPTRWDAFLAHAQVGAARRRTGAMLVRAGQRLGGLDTLSVGLSAGHTGSAC